MVEPDMPQMTVWPKRITCWIPKVTNTHTHSEYIIISGFPLQHWFARKHLIVNVTRALLVLFYWG